MITTDTGRKLELADLYERLAERQEHRSDIVVPGRNLRCEGATLLVDGVPATLHEDGVSTVDGRYALADLAEKGLGDRLGIGARYLRKMRAAEETDLYDTNVNRWLEREPDRAFLLRAVGGPGGKIRAVLSDRYDIVDDLDVLTAALMGIQRTGVNVDVTSGDLTERHMYVRVACPDIAIEAKKLVKDYRSPFSGQTGAECPVVFAGLEIANSEVGEGAFTIVPRMVIQVCSNGMTMTVDAQRKVHVGQRLAAGQIVASEATRKAEREAIINRTADAVGHFLSPTYLAETVAKVEAEAGKPIAKPTETVPKVVQGLGFGETERDLVLQHFIKGDAYTSGGLMHAMTSAAQVIDSAETAHDLEAQAVKAMSLV